MADLLLGRHLALAILVSLAACPEPCPDGPVTVDPACAPIDHGTITLANPSFELPTPLAGWLLADAPAVAVSTITGVDGCTALSLARSDGQPIAADARFTHELDATALRGQRVRMSLWARVDAGKKAHPSLAVRASAGERRMLTDMRSLRLAGEGWRLYSVEFDVPPQSDHLHLVVGLSGATRVDIDGVVLDRLGLACPGCEPPAPLSDRDLEHLSALTRLFGHVRYFHAAPEAQHIDWERVAIAGVQAALRADGPAAFATALDSLFRPLAPRLQLALGAPPDPTPSGPRRPLVVVRGNAGPTSALFPRSTLVDSLPPGTAIPDLGDAITLELIPGLHARIPLALAVSAEQFWRVVPDPAIPLDKPAGFSPDLADRTTRLAAIVTLGARLAHFSARLDRRALEAVLADSFHRAATARDRYALREVVFRIFAAIGEGTAQAHFDDDVVLPYALPLSWTWLDGQLVVTAVDERTPDLHPGDVVTAIDGRASADVLAEWRALSWGATEARRMMIAASLARRGSGAAIGLQVRRPDGSEARVEARFAHNSTAPFDSGPDEIVELDGKILYVPLGKLTADHLRAASGRLAGARGVIFSVSGVKPDVMALFRVTLGDVGAPALRQVLWPEGQPNPLTARITLPADGEPLRLPPRVAVLVDTNTQGDGEALADALRHRAGAWLVGQPTVGAPDMPVRQTLPGGLQVFVSETPYRYASGHPSFAPLQPDIVVLRTRAAIAAGRNESLEHAAAALSRAP